MTLVATGAALGAHQSVMAAARGDLSLRQRGSGACTLSESLQGGIVAHVPRVRWLSGLGGQVHSAMTALRTLACAAIVTLNVLLPLAVTQCVTRVSPVLPVATREE